MAKISKKIKRTLRHQKKKRLFPEQQKVYPLQNKLQQALALHNEGRLPEAESLYRHILSIEPEHPDALHYLGMLAYQVGKSDIAAELINKALKLRPDYVNAHNNLGIIFSAQGKLQESAACYRKALSLKPDYAEVHFNLANTLKELGRPDEAAAGYRQAISLKPGYAEAHNNLGALLYGLGKPEDAAACFQQAISLNPNYAEAYYNLGNTCKDQHEFEEAVGSYRKALTLKPDYAEALYNMGVVFRELGKLDEAETSLHRALAIIPDHIDALDNLGGVLKAQGKLNEAVSCLQRALALNPDHAAMHYNLGVIYRELGRLDEAVRCYRKALSLKPDYAAAFKDLTSIVKITEPDDAVQSMEHIYYKGDISAEDRIAIGFALGKVFEDLKNYEKSFEYICAANRITRSSYDYSIKNDRGFLERIKKIFSADFFASHPISGSRDNTPIFIVGMPRSGTTLVEQILASHPMVFGAGELTVLTDLTDHICGTKEAAQYPECVTNLNNDSFTRAGADYIDAIRKYSGNAKHITDKMPYNFLHVGLIKTVLPRAKVIHCRRNPMDTCYSIFKNYFKDAHGYAYDMVELGQYYKLYRDLMSHWEKVLPGFIYPVIYEELVANQQNQIKNLLDFCGLPWDEACLSFHKTRRTVSTASLAQVRQPIYKDSVELWKHYEKQLEPLRKTIYG